MIKAELEVNSSLSRLRGLVCWAIVAGKGTGTTIDIHFGQKIPRKQALKNTLLSEEVRLYEGEYGIFVRCSWRIDSKSDVICGCWEDNSINGAVRRELDSLIGSTVLDFSVLKPGLDLSLELSCGKFLKLFCDQTDCDEEVDNYIIFDGNITLSVGPKSRVEVATRK